MLGRGAAPEGVAAEFASGKIQLEPDQLMNPGSIAEAYWQLYRQPRDAWTFELDVRPYREVW